MARQALSEVEWRLTERLLPKNVRGVARVDDRRAIDGILRGLRTGSPWRDVETRYGPNATVYHRFNRRAPPEGPSGAFEAPPSRRPSRLRFTACRPPTLSRPIAVTTAWRSSSRSKASAARRILRPKVACASGEASSPRSIAGATLSSASSASSNTSDASQRASASSPGTSAQLSCSHQPDCGSELMSPRP